jgi:hypothetical protein
VAQVGRTYLGLQRQISASKKPPGVLTHARGWERSEPVRHASHGTLQIREKQTTRGACALRVRTRPKASRLEAVCTLYGVYAPRAWSCGFLKAARRLGPYVWCLQDDFETSEMGSYAMKGSSSPQGAEGQP